MYGGTTSAVNSAPASMGLSPRVRGNRYKDSRTTRTPGSIPACTGEPKTRVCRRAIGRVYPRVYGGTLLPLSLLFLCPGLSPRVRGNPYQDAIAAQYGGSIPACTGEPLRSDFRPNR